MNADYLRQNFASQTVGGDTAMPVPQTVSSRIRRLIWGIVLLVLLIAIVGILLYRSFHSGDTTAGQDALKMPFFSEADAWTTTQ